MGTTGIIAHLAGASSRFAAESSASFDKLSADDDKQAAPAPATAEHIKANERQLAEIALLAGSLSPSAKRPAPLRSPASGKWTVALSALGLCRHCRG